MYPDATRTFIPHAIFYAFFIYTVSIVAYEVRGILTFAVSVDNKVRPGLHLVTFLWRCGNTPIGGVH